MFVCMVDKPEPMQRGPWNKNVGNAMSSIQLIFTDRISTGGNAIASVLSSVHPSVSTLTFEPSDLWPWTFCMCMGHDHRSHGIECQGYIFRVSVCGRWDLHWRPFSSFFYKGWNRDPLTILYMHALLCRLHNGHFSQQNFLLSDNTIRPLLQDRRKFCVTACKREKVRSHCRLPSSLSTSFCSFVTMRSYSVARFSACNSRNITVLSTYYVANIHCEPKKTRH